MLRLLEKIIANIGNRLPGPAGEWNEGNQRKWLDLGLRVMDAHRTKECLTLGDATQQLAVITRVHSAASPLDAYVAVVLFATQILRVVSAGIYELRRHGDVAERVEIGGTGPMPDYFDTTQCRALRRVRACQNGCTHVGAPSLCIPLAAHGEVFGVIVLLGALPPAARHAAETVAEHCSIAVSSFNRYLRARQVSFTDPLTGLFNRHFLDAALPLELRRAGREQRELASLMGDLDFFKQVNDTAGHLAGDEVLRALGALLHRHVRAHDLAVRWGGEEFLILLRDTDIEAASTRAELIRSHAAKELPQFPGCRPPSLSIGIAMFPGDAANEVELIAKTDAALRVAKETGKNRVHIFSANTVRTR